MLGLAWDFLAALRLRLWAKLLSIAALAIGGTGISPLLHLITTPSSYPFLEYGSAVEALIYNSRLLGQFDSSVASPAWLAVVGETEKALRLPIETFGYQYAIGGFHPVLSGFLLQFLALAIIVAIPQAPEVRQRLELNSGMVQAGCVGFLARFLANTSRKPARTGPQSRKRTVPAATPDSWQT